jgi:hypothetical protein
MLVVVLVGILLGRGLFDIFHSMPKQCLLLVPPYLDSSTCFKDGGCRMVPAESSSSSSLLFLNLRLHPITHPRCPKPLPFDCPRLLVISVLSCQHWGGDWLVLGSLCCQSFCLKGFLGFLQHTTCCGLLCWRCCLCCWLGGLWAGRIEVMHGRSRHGFWPQCVPVSPGEEAAHAGLAPGCTVHQSCMS